MIDHNLYTKYSETGRLTLTRGLTLTRELNTYKGTQHYTTQDKTYTLYVAIL